MRLEAPRTCGEAHCAWAARRRPWPSAPVPHSHPPGFVRLFVLPEILKAPGRQCGIADGMLDIPVPQILLQCPGIDSLVGEIKPARMPQHVGMHGAGHACGPPGLRHDVMDEENWQNVQPLRL